jgi:hypothetical protein
MRRRHFIGLAGAATLDLVGPAYAQTKPNLPLIGVLIPNARMRGRTFVRPAAPQRVKGDLLKQCSTGISLLR